MSGSACLAARTRFFQILGVIPVRSRHACSRLQGRTRWEAADGIKVDAPNGVFDPDARGGPADCATGLTPPPLDSSAEALAAGGEEGLSTCTARAHAMAVWLPLERQPAGAHSSRFLVCGRLAAAVRRALEARGGQPCRACQRDIASCVVCRVSESVRCNMLACAGE